MRPPASLRRPTVRVGVFVLAIVVVLSVAELTSERFKAFTGGHSLISTFITEAVLLVGVYLVLDEIIQRRETRRWSDVMSLGVRALSIRADGPAEIVRRTADELGGRPPTDSEQLLSVRADELGSRLRADEARARSFAQELRRSASLLEDAIIRWGPTLVEDPESAELLNLLPDIVDAARSAADTIAPGARAWTDADRQLFGDSLLEIVRNADEFQRRVSRRAPS